MASNKIVNAQELVAIKARVKAEMLRRSRSSAVYNYGGTAYDYAAAPAANTKIALEHYDKLIEPLRAVNPASLPELGAKTVSENDMTSIDAKLALFETQYMYGGSTDCAAGCAGMCVSCTGTCTGYCSGCSGCGDACSYSCSGCSGTCTGTCTDACTGCTSCTNACTGCTSCTNACTGCTSCTNACTSCTGCTGCTGCTNACKGCGSSCGNGNCKGDCSATCASVCKASGHR